MIASLSSLTDSIEAWLTTLEVADTTYGRYKMSNSAYHNFSLDASSFAADLIYMLNRNLSEQQKGQQAEFFNSFQDSETGFYNEPFLHELYDSTIDRVIEMSGTYLSFQVCGAMEAIGRLPKYPFRFYEFALKKGAITKYIEEKLPWDYSPWGAGGWIDSIATMLLMNVKMGYETYKLPFDEILLWLKKHQNPETGLWGDPNSSQGVTGLVNGGYHLLRGTYFQSEIELPYTENIINNCIFIYRTNNYFRHGCGEGCHDLDLFDLMVQTTRYNQAYRKDEITDICKERLDEISSFQNDDGAFSFFPHRAQTEHNYYRISAGMEESDIQGTVFYLHTIRRISEYLGITFPIERSKSHGYL